MAYKIPNLKRGRIQCSDYIFLSTMTSFSHYTEFAQNSTVYSEKQQISNFGCVCMYKQRYRCHSFTMRNPQSAMNSVHVPAYVSKEMQRPMHINTLDGSSRNCIYNCNQILNTFPATEYCEMLPAVTTISCLVLNIARRSHSEEITVSWKEF